MREETLKTIELVILATDLKRHMNTSELTEQVVATGIDFALDEHASELQLNPRIIKRLAFGGV